MLEGKLSLRSREAALALGVSERTIARLKADGKLPFVRVGSAILFGVEDLKSWLQNNKTTEVQMANNA